METSQNNHDSWWQCPAEEFYWRARVELPRMVQTKFGQINQPSYVDMPAPSKQKRAYQGWGGQR